MYFVLTINNTIPECYYPSECPLKWIPTRHIPHTFGDTMSTNYKYSYYVWSTQIFKLYVTPPPALSKSPINCDRHDKTVTTQPSIMDIHKLMVWVTVVWQSMCVLAPFVDGNCISHGCFSIRSMASTRQVCVKTLRCQPELEKRGCFLSLHVLSGEK